jgi:hypothetical protein
MNLYGNPVGHVTVLSFPIDGDGFAHTSVVF